MTRGALVARSLVTAEDAPPVGGAGRLRLIEDAGVAWDVDGLLVYVGAAEGLPWPATSGSRDSGCIAPGFVDCHTHLPFVGWRADEFQARLAGRTYRD
ncbi:MAG: imidazolonepropionase, partial [Actinobacteria bacterium]|nr:imidazolonepropionase [Actinomycetota bacterium]